MGKRIETKEQRHYSIRKVSGKTASVFIGATIFSIALGAGIPLQKVSAATTDTSVVETTKATSQSSSSTSSSSSSKDASAETSSSTSADTTSSTESADKVASTNSSAETNEAATTSSSSAQSSTDSAAESSATSESSAKTSSETESANKNTSAANNEEKTSSAANTSTVDTNTLTTNSESEKSTASQAPVATKAVLKTMAAATTDSTLPKSDQTVTLSYDGMLENLNSNPNDNWVKNNVNHFKDSTYDEVRDILSGGKVNGKYGKDEDLQRYYFGALVNYNESYHVIYLFARSRDLSDDNLYIKAVHTGWGGELQDFKVANGATETLTYKNTDHVPVVTNYGQTVNVTLSGAEENGDILGLLPAYDMGQPTGLSGDDNSHNLQYELRIPQAITSQVRYVDQKTGEDIAQPVEVSGADQQAYTINGSAPTIPGYTLVKEATTPGLLSSYKVGETYTFHTSDPNITYTQRVLNGAGYTYTVAYYKGTPISEIKQADGTYNRQSEAILWYYATNYDGTNFTFGAPTGEGNNFQSVTVPNHIKATEDQLIYYYAKNGEENQSDMTLHYIDVTKLNKETGKTENFVPEDGTEISKETITGEIGKGIPVNIPANYNLLWKSSEVQQGFSREVHDGYVYVVSDGTIASQVTPKAQDQYTFVGNDVKAADSIDPSSLKDADGNAVTPKSEEWAKTPDVSKVGDTTGDVTVTYSDDSTDTVSDAPVHVVDATGKTVNVDKDSAIGNAEDYIEKTGTYPDDATFVWKTKPSTSESGTSTGVVTITLPNGQTKDVTVTVNVSEKEAALDATTKHETVTEGQAVPGDTKVVIPSKDGSTVTAKDTVDGLTVDKDGNLTGTPKINDWKDDSEESRDVEIPVTVTNGSESIDKTVTVTILRDTDGDGTPDKTDTDDDNDKIPDTDDEHPKDVDTLTVKVTNPDPVMDGEEVKPTKVIEPSIPNSTITSETVNGLSVDKDGNLTGTPKVTDWTDKAGDDSRDIEIPVTVTKGGQKVETVVPVTILRDTDGDGTPDKTDTDDDNDGIPDTEDPREKIKDAEGGHIEVDKGHTLTDEDAKNAISNHDKLPDGTTYTWNEAPDTSTAGENKPGKVTVTIPGQDPQIVDVTVTVKDNTPTTPTDAEKYDPKGQDITVNKGETPKAEDGISNKSDLPDGTDYTWKETPDTSTAGDKPATVIVTYPDGTKDEVPVTVHVKDDTPSKTTDADKYDPKGQDVTVDKGETPKAEDGISNKGDLPDGTDYTWKETPDTSTPGDKDATVIVTYPDGSKDEVPVTIHVKDDTPSKTTDADKYDPKGQDVNVDKGETPKAEDGISNKGDLPDGTDYTWKETPDTSTPGDKDATVIVTYPDGSKDEVPVTIHVKDDTKNNGGETNKNPEPKGQDIDTKPGKLPNPGDAISNKGDMPDGTDYNWVKEPDVSKPGKSTGVVEVTYPDGTKRRVTVTVNVLAEPENNNSGKGKGNGSGNMGAGYSNNNGSGNTTAGVNADRDTLPQTGEGNKSAMSVAGILMAGAAFILGLAGDRKRKRR